MSELSAVFVHQAQFLLEKKHYGRLGSYVETTLNTLKGCLSDYEFPRPIKISLIFQTEY